MDLGFNPYIAIEETTLLGLTENIFQQLTHSEYFVFIDFKREELVGNAQHLHRGSLFSHQELAIASYLSIPALVFREDGVKTDDGILSVVQGNAIQFAERDSLPERVAQGIIANNWSPSLRNELVLERDPNQFYPHLQTCGETGRFFHIAVHNLHHFKTATNCNVYLERAARLDPVLSELPIKSVEFKWAGYLYPSVNIPPRNKRRFDAFFLLPSQPTRLFFRVFSDSNEFFPQIEGAGRYELNYLVIAENFSPARASLILTLSQSIDETRLELKQ